jgi:hypothetical protein
MKRVEVEIEIAVSPQQVWDLYADVPGSAEWVPFVEQVLYVSGPAGLGQVYRERTRLGRISSSASGGSSSGSRRGGRSSCRSTCASTAGSSSRSSRRRSVRGFARPRSCVHGYRSRWAGCTSWSSVGLLYAVSARRSSRRSGRSRPNEQPIRWLVAFPRCVNRELRSGRSPACSRDFAAHSEPFPALPADAPRSGPRTAEPAPQSISRSSAGVSGDPVHGS